MNWIMTIVFFISCYPILLVMYFMMKNAANKNGFCFGATLKSELREDATIKAIDAQFRKNLKRDIIIMAIVPIPFAFIPYFSISMSLWMIWILVMCFVPSVHFGIANKKVKELKQERGWNVENAVSYSDLKMASLPRKVKLITFLPTLVLSTIPTIMAFAMFRGYGYGIYGWIVAIFSVCTYLFYACAVWSDKQKIAVICEDSEVNMNYARAKKQVWKNFSLVCAWVNTAFTWLLLYLMWQSGMAVAGILWGAVIYCVILMVATAWLVKKIFDINKKYENRRTVIDVADDDKNWLWGQVYYNKNDKHFMIENRLGTGTAVNLGNKAGMITTVASMALLLIIPVICVWMIMLEFTPIQVSVEKDTIVCEQLMVDYEIPLAEIDSYEVMTELPNLIKVNGTGMDTLLSGTFEAYREGMYEVFLNPKNELFIKIVTDEYTYIIGGADDDMTQQVLETITDYMN